MDTEVVKFLNNFPAGSFLLFVFGIVTLIVTYYKVWKAKKQEISDKGGELALKDQQEKTESSNIQQLIQQVGSLEETIENQNIELRKYVDNQVKNLKIQTRSNNEDIDKIKNQIKDYQQDINRILDSIRQIMENMNILIDSDKETIRSFILSEYHNWSGKEIDLITLQNIERLYKKYLEELGDDNDEFIDKIMTELRNLPTKR